MRLCLAFALALAACSKPALVAPPAAEPRTGDAWFAWRAEALGLSVEAARARDAALPAVIEPEALGAGVRAEAAALWHTRCAFCHGEDGTPIERPGLPTAKAWGTTGTRMGFTFGGDKMRAGIFRSIAEGKGTAMPAWGEQLAREQIAALVVHIESL